MKQTVIEVNAKVALLTPVDGQDCVQTYCAITLHFIGIMARAVNGSIALYVRSWVRKEREKEASLLLCYSLAVMT